MAKAAKTIVGIGASAGGLDAFRAFFERMSSDSGLAFVVVLHLPANRKSMLAEIISRWTPMRVIEAGDGTALEADTIYVPPPHSNTTVQFGHLRVNVLPIDSPREERPIDGFFDSMASSLGPNAIGIVMSGTGTDGALGLKAIRERGGFTLAQGRDGFGPQFDGMPSGAIATGAVDIVATIEEMPQHLLRQLATPQQAEDADADPASIEAQRLMICAILRARVGHDFSGYKDKTFLRRVQRRMQVLNIPTRAEYIERLEADQGEVVLLFRDLLIRVTSFFRDAEPFAVLEREVIPRLFEGISADNIIRIWVPGCATGEEAYSLAILLREYTSRRQLQTKIKIFATDIDEPALDRARAGRYPSTLLEGLSPARRARFFTESTNGYVVTKDIRELCTFSTHSLVRDPPFSRMNLISCRNLLIYLDTELQARVIPTFHYALIPSGILLLGSSETTARHEELFAPLNKVARIFQRRDVQGPRLQIAQQDQRRAQPDDGLMLSNGAAAAPGARSMSGEELDPDPIGTAPDARRAPALNDLVGQATRGVRSGLLAVGRRLYPDLREAESLRRSLIDTRHQLQDLTEEHGTAVEELRSANEELHSVNEELQSTIEELETSKEEIQSVNEELHTVNTQLSEKVDELDQTNSDLKNLFDSTEVATVFLDRHLIIRGFTPAVGSIYNLIPTDQGRPLTDIVSRLRYDGLRDDVLTVLDTLEPLERRVTRDDGKAHYIMRVLPYRGPQSTVDGTLVTFLDVTSVVEAEIHQRLLVDELNHRVKNMLTVVVSLAAQTLRRSDSLAAFSDAFMGRVQALTASYTLLSQSAWVDVALRDILLEETKPFSIPGGSNFVIAGPEVRMGPQGALAVGMAIHELATNAVKYGALSAANGIVRVTWRLDHQADPPQFVLEWVEENGPPVAEPVKRGFGTTLIERGFSHELAGEAVIEFRTGGVRAMLRAPLGKAIYAPHTDGPVSGPVP